MPEGKEIDALVTREALRFGQTIASYAVEVQRASSAHTDANAGTITAPNTNTDPNSNANTHTAHPRREPPWVPVAGVHGLTVGSMVVDVLAEPIRGPARVRWRCTGALPSNR